MYILEKGLLPLEHYFTNNANLKSEIRELIYTIANTEFKFLSDNGVFAKNKIDYGSAFLVSQFLKQHLDITSSHILDVGCGYGFIGIVISKLRKTKVDLIDVNKRALHLCERNIKINKVDCQAYISDCYENDYNKYDYIITNPPIRAGKVVVEKILLEAKNYLQDQGELWFVIHKDQGAKSMQKILEKQYSVEIIAKSKGFFVFCAKIY